MKNVKAQIVPSTRHPGKLSIRDASGHNIRHPLTETFEAGEEVVILPADDVCQCDATSEVVPDNAIPAFGGYCGGMEEGKPFIKIDLNALTHACAVEGMDWKWMLAETVAHEVMHAVEELVDEKFDHQRIHDKMTEMRERAEREET